MNTKLHTRLRKARFDFGRRFLPQTDITRETKNGLLTFSSRDASVGRQLYSKGQWSWEFLQEALQLLVDEDLIKERENDLLINVGANIGSMLIPLMGDQRFKGGLGFEPAPENASYLRRNVEQNGLNDQVTTFQMGLSDRSDSSQFEISSDNMGDHRVRSASPGKRPQAFDEAERDLIRVDLGRLDEMLERQGSDPGATSLLWVDIQGHEGHFLKGVGNALAQRTPMVMELWPYGIERSGMSPEEFCDVVRTLFSTVYHKRGGIWQKESTASLRALFDQYDGGTDGVDVVLVSRPT